MATLSSANTRYTAEQLTKATGISTETLATWGLTEATDTLTMSQLAEMASSDAQAKKVLEKIVAQNAEAVASGKVVASNASLVASETSATLATGSFTTAIKANIAAMWTWMTTTPLGWLTLLAAGIFAAVKAYDALNVSVEEASDKIEESRSAYEETTSTIESMNSELETTKKRIEELEAKDTLSFTDKSELDNLREQNTELERSISLLEKKRQNEAKQTVVDIKQNKDTLDKDFNESLNNLSLFKKEYEETKQNGINGMSEGTVTLENYEATMASYDKIMSQYEDSVLKNIERYEQYKEDIVNKYGTDDISLFSDSDRNLYNSIVSQLQNAYKLIYSDSEYNKFIIEPIFNQEDLKGLQDELLKYFIGGGQTDLSSLEEKFGTDIITALRNACERAGIDFDKMIEDMYNNSQSKLNQIAPLVDNPSGTYDAKQNQISKQIRDYIQNDLSDEDRTILLNATIPDDVKFKTKQDVDNFIASLREDINVLDKSVIFSGFSEEQTKAIDDFQSKVKTLGDTLSKLSDGSVTDEDLINLFQDFPMLANEGDNLSNAIQDLIYNSLEELYKLLGKNLPENFKNSLQGIADNAALNIKTISDSISDLQSIYDLMQTAKDEMANGGISASTLQNIASKYPNLEDAVNAYCAGLLTEQELYAELEKQYDADYEAFQTANQAKIYDNELFFESAIDKNDDLVDSLAKKYKVDLSNFKKISELKSEIEKKLLGNLASMWSKYYNIVLGEDGLYRVDYTEYGKKYSDSQESYDEQNSVEYQYFVEAEQKAKEIQTFFNELNDAFDLDNVMKNSRDFGDNLKDSSKNTKSTAETFDWLEVKITRATEALEKFTTVRENAFDSYEDRNSALSDEISKTKELINLQKQATEVYRNHAETIALSEDYKEKVRNGQIKIETITDEDLKSKIQDYQTWYNKSVEAEKEVRNLNKSMSELAKIRFEMISSSFNNFLDVVESKATSINNAISLIETKGYAVSSKYYEQLAKDEKNNIDTLKKEYESLNNALNEAVSSGEIEKGSEEWYAMYSSILQVSHQIEESTTNLVEFQNKIRELKWDNFDRLRDTIGEINKESDFLIELFSSKDKFNEDGEILNAGLVTAGGHAVNYNVYMAQADDYAKEYKSVMDELAKDPNNQTLIDRTRELAQAQRDAIKSAEDEKQALIDLAKDGIQKEIEAMQKLVDIKKKSLDQDDKMRQYQNTLASQADDVTALEKQIIALQGDNSQENMKRIQQLNTELEEARKTLEETQYEHWKSDQQDMLDNMMEEYEELQNERMNQTDKLFTDMISTVNANSDVINSTMQTTANSLGYTLSSEMQGIWESEEAIVSQYASDFSDHSTAVQGVLGDIRDKNQDMINKLGENATNTINAINNIDARISELKNALLGVNSAPNTSNTPNTNTPTNGATSSSSSTGTNNGKGGSDGTPNVGDKVYASGKWYTSSTGNETGIDVGTLAGKVDYFKIERINNGAAHPYWIQAYKNGQPQGGNGWVNLEQLAGYAKGTKNAKDEIAWTQENGQEMIYRKSDGALLTRFNPGDMVFTNEQTKRLWEMSRNNFQAPSFNIPNVSVPNMNMGDMNVNLEMNLSNVIEAEKVPGLVKQAFRDDETLRKQVQSFTVGQLVSGNKLGYKKY